MSRPRGTTRQYEVLEAIRAFMSVKPYAPTMRQIAELVGIDSISMIQFYLGKLEDERLIKRDKNISRGIELVGKNKHQEVDEILARRSILLCEKAENSKKARMERAMAKSMSKAQSGKQGKGADAFTPKVSKKDVGLDARIDAVVAKALAMDTDPNGDDVMLSRRLPWNRRARVRSVRVA